ncbi:MAG: hypothetical protein QOE64_2229 [Frankiales bacterium]|jgi:hypothetical protein|nr:hypothetical protein [Frankiales bacterium]
MTAGVVLYRVTNSRARWLAVVVAAGAAVLLAVPGQASAPRLSPVVRVQTPGMAGCHAESETAVAQTSAGTWVGYNDLGACQAADTVLGEHTSYLQLLPAGGGAGKVISLPALGDRWGYAGDPALAPDVNGGVVFASLASVQTPQADPGSLALSSATVRLEVLRVSPSGAVHRLPGVSRSAPFEDKEAVAVDRDPRSPHYGWVYLVWDDAVVSQVTMRAFDGHRWLPRVLINDAAGGHPDVAIGSHGRIAVAYETQGGVEVRVASDPRRPLGAHIRALAGADPGHINPTCPLINSVGLRQRVVRSPRLAWDSRDRLHLVAALGGSGLATPAPTAGDSRVVHALSSDAGLHWAQSALTEQTSWAPSIAALPSGDVAIGYLELADAAGRTFSAHVWRTHGGAVTVSPAVAALNQGTETQGSNYCYGLGDYTGIAALGSDVAYAWASTDGAAAPVYDTDVLVRHLTG